MDEIPDIPVEITNDLERRIAEVFEIFDHGGNKTIDVREVGTVMRALGCCPTEAEIQEVLVSVEDPMIVGNIHLSKFLPYMSEAITEHKYKPASPAQLLEAFKVLDPEGRGFLNREYISTLMTQDGEPFTQDELDEMLEIAIDPHTNTIPYEYYINKLMHKPPPEKDCYFIADEIEAAKPPPPPPPKTFSEIMAEMQQLTE